MKEFDENRFFPLPNTEMEILPDGTVRAWKTGTLVPDINTYVRIADTDFHNGIIELDVCSTLLPDAPGDARGFIGIVFRAAQDGREFESFYIRPANGKNCSDPVRKSRGCQYFSFPGYTFSYFRDFKITDYEGRVASIELGKWSHIKAVIENCHGEFFVDGEKVLEVNDMKHGPDSRGEIGFYVDNGSDACFKNLCVTYSD